MKKRTNKKVKSVGNGEGSLFYSEKLQCWIFDYHEPNGKRKRIKQRKNERKKDFMTRVNKIRRDLSVGSYIEVNKKTFIEILTEHVEYKYKNNLVSPRTYLRDKGTISQIEKTCGEITNMEIQKITTEHIRKVLPNMTIYSNNTINKLYRLMKKTFKIAVEDRLITYNIMDNSNIKKPISQKQDKEIEALTVEEQKNLVEVLESSNHKYKNIILLQLYTGMRVGEVLALSRDCINLEHNTITIYRTLTVDENEKVILGNTTKTTNSKRVIPINEETRKILNKIQKDTVTNINGLIFYNNAQNKLITPRASKFLFT